MFWVAKYEILAQKLRDLIRTGQILPGGKLPSENELTASEGISRQTVRQALSVLEQEGLIDRRRGSGSVVRTSPPPRPISGNIAVITTYIGEYIFPDILRGIEETLAKNGCVPMLSATRNRVDSERAILEGLLRRPADGIIVEGTKTALPNPNIDLYHRLEEMGTPIVFINGFYPDYRPAIYVAADDRAGGALATEYLLTHGHTRISGVFKSDDIQGHRRYAGFIEALRRAGSPVADDHILWYTTETRRALLGENLAGVLGGCTGVVCYNDETALEVLRFLHDWGIHVPEEMAVIGFDDSVFASMSVPQLTSLSLNVPRDTGGSGREEIGRLAAKKLLGLIHGMPQTPALLGWHIAERASV